MELFTLPPSYNTYAQNWDKQLVLHETQHVVQMTHFTKGVFKPLSFLMGEQVVGLGVAIYPGIWTMEGDAVITETELSNSGRGRVANFLAYYRASFLNGKYRSWNKWRFGSLKYYAPNAYSLGYLLNSTIRYRLNNYSFENKVFDLMVKNFFRPNSRNYAYKKITGKNLRQNFWDGVDTMTEIWKKSYDERGEKTNPKFLLNNKSSYYQEYCNVSANTNQSDTLFYVKIGNNKATSLVMLSKEKENDAYKEVVIRPFSSYTGNSLRYFNNKIYWTEPIEDSRWELNTYSDLFYYDILSKSISRLTNKKYYFNPAVSNINGSSYRIAVSEYNPNGTYFLKILDAENGKELLSFATPDNGQIIESTWLGDKLFCSIINDNGLGIFSLDINSGVWKNVIKENNNNISSLQSCRYKNNDYLYFKSDLDGVDNIYAYDIKENNLLRLTNSKYGAENPIILKDSLFYTELLLEGKLPAVIPVHMKKMGELDDYFIKNKYPIADTLSAQAQNVIKDVSTDIPEPIIKPYSKFAHLFNIHSWAPIYYNVDKITRDSYDNLYEVVSPGAVIYSQNLLGTATTMLGYSYRKGDSPVKNAFHAGHIKFTYTGFYPVIEFSADLNSDDRCKLVLKTNEGKRKLDVQYLDTPNFKAEVKTYIPFSFNRHGWQRGFIPQISWNINNNRYSYINSNEYVSLQYAKAVLQGYIMRPVAKAGIFPRYGIGTIGKFNTPVVGRALFSSAISGKVYFYLPGVSVTHGMRFNIEYQRQFVGSKPYYTDNLIEVPRGYDDIVSKNLFKVSFDYAFPIYLNDIDLGFFAYLQRLKLIPFIDYGKYTRQDKSGTLCSIGGDVLLDGYFFRIGAPASIGFRYVHLKKDPIYSNNSSGYFSLLFSFSLTK
jgi:hypothetical protein